VDGGMLYRCPHEDWPKELLASGESVLFSGGFIHSDYYLHRCKPEPFCTLAEYLGVESDGSREV